MSPSPRSTRSCASAFKTSSCDCSATRGSRSSSSRTTSTRRSSSAIASRSCGPANSSSTRPRASFSRTPPTTSSRDLSAAIEASNASRSSPSAGPTSIRPSTATVSTARRCAHPREDRRDAPYGHGFVTPGEPLIRWDWVASHTGEIGLRIGEHLELTVIAVVVGLAIAFALAFVALRLPRLYPPITAVSGILYTIPSLALFAFLVPYTGLSLLTAEIGLVSYTLLILVRNIVSGIRAVPSDVRDAALGMGYTRRAILWRIELPLALGVIFAGVRIATITTIGLVTVTALIGQGG